MNDIRNLSTRNAQGTATAVNRLVLTDFRNYAALRLEAGPAPVVLTGANGAGKTNLLEALSFLSPGRGLRRAKLTEVTRTGAGSWAVAANLSGAQGAVDIGTGLAPSETVAEEDGGARRIVRLDGAPARSAAALAEVAVVGWLTPQMDRLFIEGASARRRFLDRLVYGFDAGHARRVSAYDKTLRERARLLREGRDAAAWLDALEETLAGHGIAVAAARRDAVSRLSGSLSSGFRGRDGTDAVFPRAEVAVDGTVEAWLAEHPALEAETRFREALFESRSHDALSGGARVGPHRSDLAVTHADNGMAAAQCSTGEQKALLVAIVLADARLQAARTGCPPLLLLDEIAAHLDAVRRDALFAELTDLGVQAWLTGTDAELFAGLRGKAQFFSVAEGVVTPEHASNEPM